MKLRRILQQDKKGFAYQILEDGIWREIDQYNPFTHTSDWSLETSIHLNDGDLQLPFQPLSFRDFMLYEKHAIDAARGYVKRFIPPAYWVSRLYEGVTKRTFPQFKPSPLWYRQPTYYMSNHLAFVPSGTTVVAPTYTKALDYELELGFVLSKPLFNATPEEAIKAIGWFVVLNDFSARDVQLAEMKSGFGPQKSKHFMSSMSEILTSADEVLPILDKLVGAVYVNDELVTKVTTAGMRYSLGQALAHASCCEHLYPGELFGTGTLPGGSGMENGRWLKTGDRLHLMIEGLGDIRHTISWFSKT